MYFATCDALFLSLRNHSRFCSLRKRGFDNVFANAFCLASYLSNLFGFCSVRDFEGRFLVLMTFYATLLCFASCLKNSVGLCPRF